MARTVKMIREVSIKYGRRSKDEIVSIRGPKDVARALQSAVLDKNNTKEHFMIVMLDGSHQIIGYNTVSVGTAIEVMVHPREVFQPAVLSGAVAIILAHNHPSGQLTPSDADIDVTRKLKAAGDILGIKVLDHLIISDDNYVSLREDCRMTMADCFH